MDLHRVRRALLAIICIAGTVIVASGSVSKVTATQVSRAICSTVASPTKILSNTRLLLMVPTMSQIRAKSATSIQLCDVTAMGNEHPFYRAVASTDLDVTSDGRLLVYSDQHGLVHLVDVAKERDHVIGHGVGPRFSSDGRVLAFIGSKTAPASGAREWLEVYRIGTAKLTRLGSALTLRTGLSNPASLFAWAPHGERIAWLRSSTTSPTFSLAVASLSVSRVAVVQVSITGIDSGLAWSTAGDSILYWHAVPPVPAQSAPVASYRLMGWHLPNGPIRPVISAMPTAWFEGIAPAPVPSPQGTPIASLLGTPRGGLDQVLLYSPGHGSQAIHLPGEPSVVRFAPAGTQFAAIWTSSQGTDPRSQAGLIDPSTNRVYDLGSALGVFWLVSAPPA